jgi:hypothetical protein
MNSAAPVNVTTPADTEYTPSSVVRDVDEQLGAVSLLPHNLKEAALIVVPEVAVSLAAGLSVMANALPPVAVSGRAVGGTAH